MHKVAQQDLANHYLYNYIKIEILLLHYTNYYCPKNPHNSINIQVKYNQFQKNEINIVANIIIVTMQKNIHLFVY